MSDDERILRRFSGYTDVKYFKRVEETQGTIRAGLVIDVETTGLDTVNDEIIELALVQFCYDETGEIFFCWAGESWFNEPEKEISPHITELTGITNEMVAGKTLPPTIDVQIDKASLIVAHNGAFDRQFVERYIPAASNTPWACSMKEIDWKKLGAPGGSLQTIAWWHGFFFDGHRADIDCEALVKILAEKPALGGEPLFPTLLESARQETARIFATNAPFNRKDELRARGYQWHDGSFGHEKSWYRDMPTGDEAAAECAWLKENMLRQGPDTVSFGATTRYSRRCFG